jgi:hypothetical protein
MILDDVAIHVGETRAWAMPPSKPMLKRDGVKLPRFRGVFDGFVDYGSVVTTSIMASYAIGER